MLSDIQLVLVLWRGRGIAFRVCFCHGDVSISGHGHEAIRRWDDRLWRVVPRIAGAERRRANV
jgi:hypothetical protein